MSAKSPRKSFINLFKKNRDESYILLIKKKDINTFNTNVYALYDKVADRQSITIKDLDAVFKLLKPERREAELELITGVRNMAMEYFQDAPDYLFTSTNPLLGFFDMVETVTMFVSLRSKELHKIKKNTCIKELYQGIDLYLADHSADIKHDLSYYKKTVIATYIAFAMGVPFTGELSEKELEGRKPTKPQLFKAGNQATAKFKNT